MVRVLRRFLVLPTGEKWLFSKAFLLVLAARISMSCLRHRATRAWLRRLSSPRSRLVARRLAARRVSRHVEIAGRLVPGGGHCLTQALVAQCMLRRRGYASEVKFGVARTGGRGLEAHAWLVCDGIVVLGGGDLGRYVELQTPGSRTQP